MAREVMIRIKYLKYVRIIGEKKIQSQGPQGGSTLMLNIAYCSCNFQASSNKITQRSEIFVTSHKHKVRLI